MAYGGCAKAKVGRGRGQKKSHVSTFFFFFNFWRLPGARRFFFIAFLNSPCYVTPKNAIKKNRAKQPREGKKTEERKPYFL
jgi:hypothetical protein